VNPPGFVSVCSSHVHPVRQHQRSWLICYFQFAAKSRVRGRKFWFLPLRLCSAVEALRIGACLSYVCFDPPRFFEFDVFDWVWIVAGTRPSNTLELSD
jgi:hypothetical protein